LARQYGDFALRRERKKLLLPFMVRCAGWLMGPIGRSIERAGKVIEVSVCVLLFSCADKDPSTADNVHN